MVRMSNVWIVDKMLLKRYYCDCFIDLLRGLMLLSFHCLIFLFFYILLLLFLPVL